MLCGSDGPADVAAAADDVTAAAEKVGADDAAAAAAADVTARASLPGTVGKRRRASETMLSALGSVVTSMRGTMGAEEAEVVVVMGAHEAVSLTESLVCAGEEDED